MAKLGQSAQLAVLHEAPHCARAAVELFGNLTQAQDVLCDAAG